jgi:hypothetical protein
MYMKHDFSARTNPNCIAWCCTAQHNGKLIVRVSRPLAYSYYVVVASAPKLFLSGTFSLRIWNKSILIVNYNMAGKVLSYKKNLSMQKGLKTIRYPLCWNTTRYDSFLQSMFLQTKYYTCVKDHRILNHTMNYTNVIYFGDKVFWKYVNKIC